MLATTGRQSLSLRLSPFSHPAPVPPIALVGGQSRIARLLGRAAKHVENAGVLPLPGDAAQPVVHLLRIGFRQLIDRTNPQFRKIIDHLRPDSCEVFQLSVITHVYTSGNLNVTTS